MPDFQDYELEKTPETLPPPPSPPQPPVLLWVFVALVVAVIAVTAYILFRSRTPPPVQTGGASGPVDQAASEPRKPLGSEPMPVTLPSLDDSDAVVRTLVASLSSHPRVAAWLATKDLVRNFTVVVTNIAEGQTPARRLASLRPAGRFQAIERGGGLYLDPRSYERYTPLAAAVASIDPAGSARLYATLKPLIEEAHRELGDPDTPFDRILERAMARLLNTPILTEPVRLQPKGIGYAFGEAKVEALAPAQKQFLRFGPQNVRLIQDTLSRIAAALGIPAQ